MNYFETNEKNDLQQLYEFNYELNLFDSIEKTKDKSQIDAIAKHKDRTFAIELKHRFIPLGKYKTIFIEDYKLASMMLEYTVNHREPLYINILDDGTVVIFNLLKLKQFPKLRITDIKSEGYDKNQLQERRYLLSLDDAVIYKNNQIIKPMGKEWNNTTNYS